MSESELMAEARGWLADCGLRHSGPNYVLRDITEREYDGGWEAFESNSNV